MWCNIMEALIHIRHVDKHVNEVALVTSHWLGSSAESRGAGILMFKRLSRYVFAQLCGHSPITFLQDLNAFEEQEMTGLSEFISQFLEEDKWAFYTSFLKHQSM